MELLIAACALSLISAICSFSSVIMVKKMNKKSETLCNTQVEVQQNGTKSDAPVAVAEKEDDAVSFAAEGVKQTLDDKYGALDNDSKGYYDEIVRCASDVEGVKKFRNSRYEEYKVGNSRIVRLLIKRDTVICEFILQNSDFKDYVAQNKVAIRPAPTVLKITSAEMLKTACDSIAIVVKQIEAEKEAKRLEMLERRRERRRLKNQ